MDGSKRDEGDVRRATEEFDAEFPYDRGDEAQVTRREFCNFLFLTSSSLLAGTAGFAAKSVYDASKEAPHAAALIEGAEAMEPGTALTFYYPGEHDSAILIRSRDGSYNAFGQKCTHLTCPVYYEKMKDRLECPCHEGGFDARTGAVLYGPPPRPLNRILIEIRGSEVWATGRESGSGAGGHES